MDERYTYLILMLGSLFFPLILSFDNRVRFVRKWKYLPLPMLVSGLYFIVWDHQFTQLGVWSFNEQYILGHYLFLLPLEEWLFFIVIPFNCLFIYECLNTYFAADTWLSKSRVFSGFLLVFLVIISAFHLDKMYTLVNFLSMAVILALVLWQIRPVWLGRFYRAYLVSLVPFLLVNGLLTSLPVVIYDPMENLGIFLLTIPAEDTIYLLLLLLMNTTIYEWLKARDNKQF
jgi:lycopene cyclase domain-containing protein